MENNAHKCIFCEKIFPKKFNLNRHLRNVHEQEISDKATLQCPLCPVLSKNIEQLNCHIEIEHDLKIEKDLKFQNNEEFLIWKSKEENSKICKFVQHRGAEKRWTVDFTTTTYYYRRGYFKSNSMGLQHLKSSKCYPCRSRRRRRYFKTLSAKDSRTLPTPSFKWNQLPWKRTTQDFNVRALDITATDEPIETQVLTNKSPVTTPSKTNPTQPPKLPPHHVTDN
ncbi:hypothetical protein TNCV_4493001 [Trichonephila clavipes]|uniref:C2H2-type domain-containing protein n=1 Tax=Trichonephila clavipes TaxID=2585209 RepID=A0A8X6SJV2_TRICX|nr:hypothetical protein TNCV_4493001 [Trichonephila clavipes]